MQIDWCKIFGHRWTQIYTKGQVKGITVRAIFTHCERLECEVGLNDMHRTIKQFEATQYCTHTPKYYHEDTEIV
jgi:hypothetical protein